MLLGRYGYGGLRVWSFRPPGCARRPFGSRFFEALGFKLWALGWKKQRVKGSIGAREEKNKGTREGIQVKEVRALQTCPRSPIHFEQVCRVDVSEILGVQAQAQSTGIPIHKGSDLPFCPVRIHGNS